MYVIAWNFCLRMWENQGGRWSVLQSDPDQCAPEETSPTPAPDQVASAAVTTNGNLTMVNTYLAEQDAAGISSAESSDSQSDADSTDNSVDSADNNEQDSSTSDTEE